MHGPACAKPKLRFGEGSSSPGMTTKSGWFVYGLLSAIHVPNSPMPAATSTKPCRR
jgi:hypothetical protein